MLSYYIKTPCEPPANPPAIPPADCPESAYEFRVCDTQDIQ